MISFFFFKDTATTEIYTLSLHDALPIFTVPGIGRLTPSSSFVSIAEAKLGGIRAAIQQPGFVPAPVMLLGYKQRDRKSTRLNSSHANISYAVFCLKKKTHILYYTIASRL